MGVKRLLQLHALIMLLSQPATICAKDKLAPPTTTSVPQVATTPTPTPLLSEAETKALSEMPLFWRNRKDLLELMKSERKIVVSAKKNDDSAYSLKGVGLTRAPVDFCYETALQMHRLQELKDHFREVDWDRSQLRLRVKMRFMGMERSLEVRFEEDPFASQERRLRFKVVGGWLQGLYGQFLFKSVAEKETEVALLGLSPDQLVKLPDFIVLFAVEGIMHHVASSLRSMVENEFSAKSTAAN